ncbi:MAG TPA: HU family DNA-binding protein [Candidatus Methylomirabilis sp.]|jgi:DNA-binding protein HU-beta|nr:HU family DNA-binding protein [Candidatus Methylomirabilis sp.]
MTKAELVAIMAKGSGMTKRAAETALESSLKAIRDTLKKGRKVTLVGFGTFSVAKRAARNGRNPQTGKAIRIPAARVPRFKPGKELKRAIK